MHGLGNDFVVIDCINQSVSLNREQCRFIADRHFGIGCDQILLVEKASGDADFFIASITPMAAKLNNAETVRVVLYATCMIMV